MVTLERVRAKPEEKSQEVIPAYNFKTTRVISQNIMKIENPKECGETFRVMRDFAQAGLGYAAIFFQEMQKNNVLTPQMSNIFHRDKWIAFYPRNKNLELATFLHRKGLMDTDNIQIIEKEYKGVEQGKGYYALKIPLPGEDLVLLNLHVPLHSSLRKKQNLLATTAQEVKENFIVPSQQQERRLRIYIAGDFNIFQLRRLIFRPGNRDQVDTVVETLSEHMGIQLQCLLPEDVAWTFSAFDPHDPNNSMSHWLRFLNKVGYNPKQLLDLVMSNLPAGGSNSAGVVNTENSDHNFIFGDTYQTSAIGRR